MPDRSCYRDQRPLRHDRALAQSRHSGIAALVRMPSAPIPRAICARPGARQLRQQVFRPCRSSCCHRHRAANLDIRKLRPRHDTVGTAILALILMGKINSRRLPTASVDADTSQRSKLWDCKVDNNHGRVRPRSGTTAGRALSRGRTSRATEPPTGVSAHSGCDPSRGAC